MIEQRIARGGHRTHCRFVVAHIDAASEHERDRHGRVGHGGRFDEERVAHPAVVAVGIGIGVRFADVFVVLNGIDAVDDHVVFKPGDLYRRAAVRAEVARFYPRAYLVVRTGREGNARGLIAVNGARIRTYEQRLCGRTRKFVVRGIAAEGGAKHRAFVQSEFVEFGRAERVGKIDDAGLNGIGTARYLRARPTRGSGKRSAAVRFGEIGVGYVQVGDLVSRIRRLGVYAFAARNGCERKQRRRKSEYEQNGYRCEDPVS